MGIVKETRRYWNSKEPDSTMSVYAGMEGRITVGELLAYLVEEHPQIEPHTVMLNWSTATWEDKPTPAEIAERDERQSQHERRHEAWERSALIRLKAKYEPRSKIQPPWDEATVDALNAFQKAGEFHPFTCPRTHRGGSKSLFATADRWVCPASGCDYEQDWAHAFMAAR